MNRVTKKESTNARKCAKDILKYFHNTLRDKYKFTERLVGSAQWNTILKDNSGHWDIDYQIILTSNSNEYKINGLKHATQIKNDFFNCLNDVFNDNKKIRIENSTTAITYVDIENNFSIDFVIIKLFPFNKEIIRRNNKENSSVNEFTWNPLRKFNQAYEKMKSLTSFQKQDLIQNYIFPKKIIEKQKKDSDPSRKSSCEIFIEEVNNYVVKKQNH